MKFGNNLDLAKNELRNAVVQVLGTAPSTPANGQIYIDSTKAYSLGVYNGSSWDYYAFSQIANSSITYSKIQDVSAQGKILGRSSSGAGVIEEITISTGLTLTGSNLTAAVTSVAGRTGVVTLTSTDVGLNNLVNNLQVINGGGTPSITSDLFANRPSAGTAGRVFISTDTKEIYRDTGSVWEKIGTGTAGGGSVTDVSVVSVNGFAGSVATSTSTPAITLSTTVTGLLKGNGTAISAATAGTDYLTGASSNALTNKTFDANGTGNSISNIETADFATNVIDTDTTLAANSDTRIASQKAVKAYIDNLNTADMNYIGAIDCSANPNYPAGTKGDYYKISVAGKIGGASGTDVSVGDAIICNTTAASGNEATVGSSWDKIQANVEQATTSTLGLVALADSTVAEAKSDTAKALTAASVANFPIKKTFTIGDGSTTSFVLTHNLGTVDILVQVRLISTGEEVIVDNLASSTTQCTITFSVAPATNTYKVIVIG